MLDRITTILLAIEQSICGAHGTLLQGQHGLAGPVLGNAIVIGLAGGVTLACVVAALWMLIRPGERNQNHPKYRILKADR